MKSAAKPGKSLVRRHIRGFSCASTRGPKSWAEISTRSRAIMWIMLEMEAMQAAGSRWFQTMEQSGKVSTSASRAHRCEGVFKSQRSPGRCQSSSRSRSA